MTDKPNILLIIVDSLRADALGCYRSGVKTTPNLDRLAREGVSFSNFFSQSSWTLPSFATVFSGLYPWEHGYFNHHAYYPGDNFLFSCRRAGYDVRCCVAFSFFQINFRLPRLTTGSLKINDLDAAADYVEGLVKSRNDRAPRLVFWHIGSCHLPYFTGNKIAPGDRIGSLFQENLFGGFSPSPRVPPFLLPVISRVVRRPLPGKIYRKLKNAEKFKKPLLGMINRWGGGRERTVLKLTGEINSGRMILTPEEIRRLREAYAYSVSVTDDRLRRVFDRVRNSSGREWKIIVTSDHGEELMEKGVLWHKTSLYQSIVRVPLIAWSSARREAGRVEKACRSHVNLAPTVLELADLASRRPEHSLGKDFRPSTGRADGPVLCADLRSLAVIRPPFKLILTADGEIDYSKLASVRFVRTELYDIEKDPGEEKDLSGREPRLADELTRELMGRLKTGPGRPGRGISEDEREKLAEDLTALGYL